MNRQFQILVTLSLCLIFVLAGYPSSAGFAEASEAKTIRISGAWALYPMMVVWADEYQQTHEVKINVSGGGAGKGVSDALTGQVDIGMVSRPIREEEIQQGAFYVAVTKDAVVATINSSNPVLDEIFSQGLSQTDLQKIFLRETTRWCEVVGVDCPPTQKDKTIVYGRSDASGAAKVWASFLGDLTQSELQDKADANFNGDQPLAHAVNREKNSIGFNNLNYTYNPTTGEFAGNIRPIPLDQNGNDVLEAKENFYMNRNNFVENVSAGNYPSPPARLEYLLSKGPFTGGVKGFVSWILTEGQKYVEESGYVRLSEKKLSKEMDFLEKGIRK